MTSRELVNRFLKGQPVERIGIYDHGPWSTTYQRWIKEGYPTFNPSGASQPVPVPHFEHFRYDMSPVAGWVDWTPIANI
ncbi:MAG: hypothetical protein HY360_00415 [Verrucomicrobia bacterium]|nr:hypothetical protein [Verrucomicrobiota bacterium]